MNQNDADRYYWRRGYPWSGDGRSLRELRGEIVPAPRRIWWLLLTAFLVTVIILARLSV